MPLSSPHTQGAAGLAGAVPRRRPAGRLAFFRVVRPDGTDSTISTTDVPGFLQVAMRHGWRIGDASSSLGGA